MTFCAGIFQDVIFFQELPVFVWEGAYKYEDAKEYKVVLKSSLETQQFCKASGLISTRD